MLIASLCLVFLTMSTLPFQIHVSDDKLDRLRKKLELSDYPEHVPVNLEKSWSLGPPVAEIRRLARYWQTGYDWRKAEARLNELQQYITQVEVDDFEIYNIHHIHRQSSRTNAIPLLFLHGWPGSFLEVTKMLDKLVEGDDDSCTFHVVAPSLIDFGFSSASGNVSERVRRQRKTSNSCLSPEIFPIRTTR
jgi:pimeloyl-ACP methyl ester carboxylesterase